MEREGDDQTVAVRSPSSIALLQERFRRLQREKQIREERDMIRGGRCTVHYDPSATACFFFHPELMANLRSTSLSPPPPLADQVVLSPWPNGSEVAPKPGAQERMTILMVDDLSPAGDDARVVIEDVSALDDDIDTSLHL